MEGNTHTLPQGKLLWRSKAAKTVRGESPAREGMQTQAGVRVPTPGWLQEEETPWAEPVK